MLLRRIIEHFKSQSWTVVALEYFIQFQRDLHIAYDILNEPAYWRQLRHNL